MNTSEVKHSYTCNQKLKSANIKCFCEQICNILIYVNLDHLNRILLIGISDKMMSILRVPLPVIFLPLAPPPK
ncbi:hypothetical protein Tco_0477099, partial [Tanacetum coccineum]